VTGRWTKRPTITVRLLAERLTQAEADRLHRILQNRRQAEAA
jgi:hypothetical protein